MKKINKNTYLPEKLNFLFINLILSSPLRDVIIKGTYKDCNFQKLYNLITSIHLLFDDITKEINNLTIINDRSQVVNLVNNISIINEGISTLIKDINNNFLLLNSSKIKLKEKNEQLFYNNWLDFWKIKVPFLNITNDIDEILSSDDTFFEYLRALLMHPLNTSRHPKSKNGKDNESFFKYLKEQSAPFIEFLNSKNNDQLFEIKIMKLKSTDKEIKDQHLSIKVSFNALKRYARNKYTNLQQIIKWFENCRKLIIKDLNHNCEWSKDNLTFLNQYIKTMQEKYLDTYFFEIFRDKYLFFLNEKLVNEINRPAINEYFDTSFKLLRKNIKKLEYYDFNKSYDLYEIIDVAKMHPNLDKYISVYDFHKINLYLKGDRSGAMPKYRPYSDYVTNEEIFLGVINDFYEKSAYKYISMNIEDPNLTFLEIRLLLDVSVYKLSKDKN